MSRYTIVILAITALVAAGCGGSAPSKPAPGTPQNPLIGKTTTPDEPSTANPTVKKSSSGGGGGGSSSSSSSRAGRPVAKHPTSAANAVGTPKASTTGEPGYQALVERQTSKPKSRFTPCNLVSEAEARVLIGAPVQQPFEAPQGPTCIYRGQKGKPFVTVAVQAVGMKALKPAIHKPQHVAVSSHAGLCSSGPAPALFVPIRAGKVLVVGASCGLAKAFALKALPHL